MYVIAMSVRRVVVAIIYKKNEKKEFEFLILQRAIDWSGWEFPKGAIEKNDKTDEMSVRREIFEETGIKNIRIISKLPYEIRYKYPKKYSEKYKHTETVQSVFLVRSFEEQVKTSVEHKAYKWLNYENARKLLTHTQQRKALDIAWKFLRGKLQDEGNVTF